MKFDDLDRIFPIVGAPSAQLMKIKAHCLYDARIITAMQKVIIDHRADAALARASNRVESDESQALKDLAVKAARRYDAMQKAGPVIPTDRPHRSIVIHDRRRRLERSG